MSESFEHRPISALLSQSRLVGLQDTSFSVQLRSYYLNRDTMDHTISEAWTLGGLAGFKTGYFYDLVAIGATGIRPRLSMHRPIGTVLLLLGPQQTPYTVIGELYGEFKITPKILATVGKRGFDTPYINTQDAIMTPYTFWGTESRGKSVVAMTRSLTSVRRTSIRSNRALRGVCVYVHLMRARRPG